MPAASGAHRVVSSLSLRQVNNSEVSPLVAVILQLIDRMEHKPLKAKINASHLWMETSEAPCTTSSHLLIFMATGLLAEVAALIHSTQFPWRDSLQLRLITVRHLNKE